MTRSASIGLAILLLCGCSTPECMTVDSNVKMPGEASTASRQLSVDEQRSVLVAMSSVVPADEPRQPLAQADERGRWREVSVVASEAAKSCEMAIVRETRTADGKSFQLRSLRDESGTLVVTGDAERGVTGVQARVGAFNENRAAATALQDAFWRKLREYARVPRPQ